MTEADVAAAAAAAAAAASVAPWFQGKVDADVIAHWQNKGYDVNDPVKVSVAATKAHMEAEKMIGAPAAQLIRLPAEQTPEAMKAIWQRLGAPLDAKDYDFPALKDKDGKITDTRLADSLREVAANSGMTKDMAANVAAAVAKVRSDETAAADADVQAQLKTEHETLKKNWGTREAANKVIAQNAARALGMTPEEVAALEKVVGYARTMDTLFNIGTKIGEAKFIRPDGEKGSEIASRDQAIARLAELKRDEAWVKRLLAGDVTTQREFDNLSKMIAGDEMVG